MNTRRYHGLLVASLKPPVERYVLLSKLEETLFVDGAPYELSVNQYPNVVHPQGQQYLDHFGSTRFRCSRTKSKASSWRSRCSWCTGRTRLVVQYCASANVGHFHELQLLVRPLIAFRDYHSTTHENGSTGSPARRRGWADSGSAICVAPGLLPCAQRRGGRRTR